MPCEPSKFRLILQHFYRLFWQIAIVNDKDYVMKLTAGKSAIGTAVMSLSLNNESLLIVKKDTGSWEGKDTGE